MSFLPVFFINPSEFFNWISAMDFFLCAGSFFNFSSSSGALKTDTDLATHSVTLNTLSGHSSLCDQKSLQHASVLLINLKQVVLGGTASDGGHCVGSSSNHISKFNLCQQFQFMALKYTHGLL
ncbi:hypothetical protein ACED47_21610 [Vibrio splendidus]|uniref:hypothetical protein n=1 Tax=Vibrio splendidus TaxID=29497 RepID=UPI00352C0ED1